MSRYWLLAAVIAAAFASPAFPATCPPNQSCPQLERPPPARPAPPRREPLPPVRPMVAPAPAPRAPTYQPAPGYRPAPRPAPSLPSSGPETVRRYNGVGGPAYARHYGGGENGAPRLGRNPRGPAYVYHGRTYAPVVAGRYRWPRGYGYHRFHRHERFPRVFLIPDYFIADYYDYGLAQPPPDAQWVRYGDDLVLVDLDTDEILDTIPGFFADEGDGGDAGPPDYGDQGPPPDEGPPPPDAAPY